MDIFSSPKKIDKTKRIKQMTKIEFECEIKKYWNLGENQNCWRLKKLV